MIREDKKLTAVFVVTDLQRLIAGALIAKYSEPCVMCLTGSKTLNTDMYTLINEKPEVGNIILAGVKITYKNLSQVSKFMKDHAGIPVKWYIKKDFLEQEKIKVKDLPDFVHIYSDSENRPQGKFRDFIGRDFKVTKADYDEYSALFDYFGEHDAVQIKSEVMACCSGEKSKKACSEDKAMWWLTLQWAIQKTRSFGYDDVVYKEIKELWDGEIPESKKKWLKNNAAILDGRLMGSSQETRKILSKIDKLANFPYVPVIFYGPTGTGKELLSSLLHLRSRREGKYIKINCAGLPEDVMECILFGVKGGRFTDVKEDQEGLVKEADGGTIFLDEIAEMPMIVQAKLLRFVQFKTYRLFGDNVEKSVDVRIIAATNANLRKMVKEGRFREDLLFRLAGEEIVIPSLKERMEDLDDIANRYYMEFCQENRMQHRFLRDEEIAELKKYDWPGNIRELQRVLRKAVMYKGPQAEKYDFCKIIKEERHVQQYGIYGDEAVSPDSGEAQLITEDEVASIHARRVYEAVGRNKTKAIAILKIVKNTLDRRLGLK